MLALFHALQHPLAPLLSNDISFHTEKKLPVWATQGVQFPPRAGSRQPRSEARRRFRPKRVLRRLAARKPWELLRPAAKAQKRSASLDNAPPPPAIDSGRCHVCQADH